MKTWNSQLLERHSGLRAQLVNFKILSDGKWKLLITFQAVARWELYHRYTGRQFHACHTLFNFVEFSSDDLSDKKFNSLFLTYRRPRAYGTDVLEIFGQEIRKTPFTFPVQDGTVAEINFKSTPSIWWNWSLGKVYNAGGEQIADFSETVNATDAHKWNMSIVQLKGGDFLFGYHDGELFRIRDGTFELVGSGLKNFRLRELKRITKSKK